MCLRMLHPARATPVRHKLIECSEIMTEKVCFPGDEAVLGYLVKQTGEHFRKQRAGGTATASPPNRDQFDILLRTCFAASLEQDESRRVEFTLFYDAEAMYVDYLFEKRPELTPHVLTRLSAALDSSCSYLCVTAEESGLYIAGIRHWGDHSSFAPTGGQPSHVVIRVVAPGIFVVQYDTSIILTYRRGIVAHYPNDFSAHNGAMSALLPEESCEMRDAAAHIAKCMVRLRHGGTLLILPKGTVWKARTTTIPFAALEPVVRVHDAFVSAKHGYRVRTVQSGERARRLRLAEFASSDLKVQLGVELEWIAQLTATDGMTVVTTDLTLLGFGVFFETSDIKLPMRVINSCASKDASVIGGSIASLGGARHQAAAITCHTLPGATALVASQDGTLTAMRSGDDGYILVNKHLELLL